jgi:membrane protein implicated in regulation of membrane protease activity
VALLIGGTLALIFLDLPWSAIVIALLVGVEYFEFRVWRWAVHQRPRTGVEGLVGAKGVLLEGGRVRIHGASYAAKSEEAGPGDSVVVEGTEGTTLIVRPTEEADYA